MVVEQLVLDRRAFLKLAGATGVVAAAAGPLSSLVTGTEAALGQAPAPPDLAGLAALLDYDIQKIFRFVADEIRYEPYAGILRGPAGAVSAMAGNSVDQA